MIPFGGSLDGKHVSVDGTFESPQIHLHCNSALLVLKATPRITSADVVYLVKGDRPEAAACCAASFDLTSPSLSFPAPMLHTFAPLFFFDGELPSTALTTIGELNPHEIVLIGLPDDQAAADAMFEKLFDPRRELLIVIEEAERSCAERALARLHATIDSEIGGRSLLRAAAFRSAAAQSLQYNPFDSIQLSWRIEIGSRQQFRCFWIWLRFAVYLWKTYLSSPKAASPSPISKVIRFFSAATPLCAETSSRQRNCPRDIAV